MQPAFWARDEVVLLRSDDGSAIWVSCSGPAPEAPADVACGIARAERGWVLAIEAVGHPGPHPRTTTSQLRSARIGGREGGRAGAVNVGSLDAMTYRRLDRTVVPDVDLMLAVLCDVRHLDTSQGRLGPHAAALALRRFGVDAEAVPPFMMAMNGSARRLVAEGVSVHAMRSKQDDGGEPAPEMVPIGSALTCEHVAVRADGWLLDLEIAPPGTLPPAMAGAPIVTELAPAFWAGEEAVLLRGDDGSAIWVTRSATQVPPVEDGAVCGLADQWCDAIGAVGHPGWLRPQVRVAALSSPHEVSRRRDIYRWRALFSVTVMHVFVPIRRGSRNLRNSPNWYWTRVRAGSSPLGWCTSDSSVHAVSWVGSSCSVVVPWMRVRRAFLRSSRPR